MPDPACVQTDRVWAEVVPVSASSRHGPSIPASLVAITIVSFSVGWILRAWVGLLFSGIFVVMLILERRGPSSLKHLARRVRSLQARFGSWLQRVLLAVIWVLVVLPLSRLWRPAASRSGTGWHHRAEETGVAFARQFAAETPPVRDRDLRRSGRIVQLAAVVGALALLVAVDVAAGSLARLARETEESVHASLAAYANVDWAERYWETFDERQRWKYVPYLGYFQEDVESPYVNISDGERATWSFDEQGAVSSSTTVWMFGGSTTFGTGQRDRHTIASELAKLSADAGIRLDVRNFGVSSYRLWQENLHLSYRLLREDAPDLVIFYDGVNEPQGHGEVDSPSPTRALDYLFRERLEQPQTAQGAAVEVWRQRSLGLQFARFVRQKLRPPALSQSIQAPKSVPADRALDNIIGIYSEGVAVSHDIAARHGFEVVHFWQPNIYTKVPNPAELDAWEVGGYRTWDRDWYASVYSGARERIPESVIDISDALDATNQAVMIDHVHTNELGARLVAERIFAELGPLLVP